MPSEPPVSRKGEHFRSLDLNVEAVDTSGRIVPPPKGLRVEVDFHIPHQLDPDIERIKKLVHDAPSRLIRDREPLAPDTAQFDWIVNFGYKAERVADALYAVRYHQREFFARLRIVTTQQAFAFSPPSGESRLGIDDHPLRFELEAMVVRATSVLDALAKYALYGWNRQPENWGALVKKLDKDKSIPEKTRAELHRLRKFHAKWLQDLTAMRHLIVHEATFPAFRPMSHVCEQLFDVSVDGIPAGAFAIQTWVGLRELAPKFCSIAATVAVPPSSSNSNG
jgi:hypothetical protein